MAASTKPSRPTQELMVTRYRREAARAQQSPVQAPHPELEVRFQNVDYENFAAIYAALVRGAGRDGAAVPVGPGALTQVVSAIVTLPAASDGTRALRPMRIREMYFEGGRRVREKFIRKEPLLIPYRVPSSTGIPYIVALSAERQDAVGFSSDESTIIRAKARVGFPLRLQGTAEARPELLWRVDMTVTRQIMGSDADSALKAIVGQMFRTAPAMTATTLLSSLGLEADAAKRALYRYEVEAEFLGPPPVRDALRPADVTAVAEALLRLANPEHVREAAHQALIYRAAQHLIQAPAYRERFQHELGLKSLLPPVQALTRAAYRTLYPPKGLYMTDKAEGVRALAVVQAGRGAIAATVLHDGFAPDPSAGAAAVAGAKAGDTILDGELMAEPELAFYAFDAIAVAGEDVAQEGFERRLGRLAEGVAILRAAGLPARAKSFEHLASDAPAAIARAVGAVLDAARPYPVDGLILVEPGRPYRGTNSYKWKSAHHNTADFLAKRPPKSVLGKQPWIDRPGHRLYFLFVGVDGRIAAALGAARCPGYGEMFPAAGTWGPSSYQPTHFTPSDAPLAYIYQHPLAGAADPGEIDGKVVELRCAGGCRAAGGGSPFADWELVRVREDRERELRTGQYFGNDLRVAEYVWLNYLDPFPREQLADGPGLSYFQSEKSPLYRAQTAVTSYVKTQRIATLKHAGWVVDLGAGKGQDLGRYLAAEIGHLVAVDSDRAALGELVRRKYDHAAKAQKNRAPAHEGRPRGTVIHVLAADITENFSTLLNRFEQLGLQRYSADAVVCNLALHYMMRDLDSLRNFVALVRGALKVGGKVILTILRGDLVHQLFRANAVPPGGTWDVFEEPPGLAAAGAAGAPVRKYSLRRDYSSETLEETGQQIGAILPFTGGQYYIENLVNPAVVAREFVSRGFKRDALTRISDSLGDFESRNRAVAAALTPGDKQFLSLYGELCFTREK